MKLTKIAAAINVAVVGAALRRKFNLKLQCMQLFTLARPAPRFFGIYFIFLIGCVGQVGLAAPAVMDIEIMQGRAGKINLVVDEFFNQQHYPDRFQQYLSEIIRADLKNSGYFLPIKGARADAENVQVGGSGTAPRVQGEIKVLGNTLRISYQLVASGSAGVKVASSGGGQLSPKTRVMLSGSYRVAPSQIRKVAHRISSDIYQHIIGKPSVFETKLAYVLVTKERANLDNSQNGGGAAKAGRTRQRQLRQPKNVYSIVVSDYDGFDTQTLLQSAAPIMSLSWSPDGQKLAYVSFEGNRSAIYIQDLESGKREIVSKMPGINGAPAWSPDGQKLALVLTTSGYPKIHLLDLVSRQLTQLTHGNYCLDTEPNWSPDGRSLVFTSDRSGTPQIYQLELASGAIKRITQHGNYNARASFVGKAGSVVMPGRKLAGNVNRERNNGSEGGEGARSIVFLHRHQKTFTVAAQSLLDKKGQIKILAAVGGTAEAPTISPGGEMVIFVRKQQGISTLSAVSLDGERGMVLPGIEGEVRDPAWSAR